MTIAAIMAGQYFIAFILGAAWRRWWGWVSPDWWPWRTATGKTIGYRAFQAVVGVHILFGLCWAAQPWWQAGLSTGAAMAAMTVSAHTRDPFIWLAERLPLPIRGSWLDGPNAWAEHFQGATMYLLAAIVPRLWL